MAAGNSSNTVFTAIPVGEDFYMSFSTERFFHNINPADILTIEFKLYDAGIIGNVGSPNPNALIETVSSSLTPGRFSVGSKAVAVSVASVTLDAYETTKTAGATVIFRGELYGYANVTVGGEESNDFLRMSAAPIATKTAINSSMLEEEPFWDGYFYQSSTSPIVCKLTVPPSNLSGTGG